MPSPNLSSAEPPPGPVARRLGLVANLGQFSLLALMTFGVGLLVGAERE